MNLLLSCMGESIDNYCLHILPTSSIIKFMIKRVCEYCKKEYETAPSVKKHFCCMKCVGASKKKGKTHTCVQCNKEFFRSPSNAGKYCSRSCATVARNLSDKNPSYHRDVSGENNPMYGKGFKGKDNPMYGKTKEKSSRWNGGEKKRKDRYILVIAPDDHPYPADIKKSGTKYILEHRYVMEQHIGRYIAPEEVVHHLDGNPANNSIENLQLFSSKSEHMLKAHPRR